jgi:hypothetical protein
MSATARTYDLNQVQLMIGGVVLGGYGADGGIEIAPTSDLYEVTTGADGLTVASRLNDNDAVATLTLSERSTGYAALMALVKVQQLAATPVLVPLPFLLLDPINGDQVSAAQTIFLSLPTISKSRTAGDRVLTMHLPNGMSNAIFGVLNVIPV